MKVYRQHGNAGDVIVEYAEGAPVFRCSGEVTPFQAFREFAAFLDDLAEKARAELVVPPVGDSSHPERGDEP